MTLLINVTLLANTEENAAMALVPSPTILSTDEMGRIAPPIFAAVGRGAENRPGDVFVVQALLNDRLPRPHSDVPVTGDADIGTLLAIEAYQAVVLRMIPPTGRVEPASATYYALAARPLVADSKPSGAGHFGQVPSEIVEAAVASRVKWTVPASITLAQWAVESAWGAAMPPGSNNPFGIKAVGDQPAVESATREVVAGESITIQAKFRKFASLSEAFDVHGRLLATVPLYGVAMQNKDDPEAFADALTGVYATDPAYGTTLKYVIKAYGFAVYDK
jgi:Mannosyl-glycoprotein endo-beta-N-acetylglucosaminidase